MNSCSVSKDQNVRKSVDNNKEYYVWRDLAKPQRAHVLRVIDSTPCRRLVAKQIYRAIATATGADGLDYCYYRLGTLKQNTGASRDTVKRNIRWLVGQGWIDYRPGSGHTRNQFRTLWHPSFGEPPAPDDASARPRCSPHKQSNLPRYKGATCPPTYKEESGGETGGKPTLGEISEVAASIEESVGLPIDADGIKKIITEARAEDPEVTPDDLRDAAVAEIQHAQRSRTRLRNPAGYLICRIPQRIAQTRQWKARNASESRLSYRQKPKNKEPIISASELIEALKADIENYPNHVQLDEWKKELELLKAELEAVQGVNPTKLSQTILGTFSAQQWPKETLP